MKRFRFFPFVLVLLALCFSQCAPDNSNLPADQKFWAWFSDHSDELFDFEKNQDSVFASLDRELSKVDPGLTFEFGPVGADQKREFIVSADGVQKLFPTVDSLVKKAPKLDKWKFVAFRQRKSTDYTQLSYRGLSLQRGDGYFLSYPNGKKMNVDIYLKGYRDTEDWMNFGYLLLDYMLGEYDTEMNLGIISFYDLGSMDPTKLTPLDLLQGVVDQQKATK